MNSSDLFRSTCRGAFLVLLLTADTGWSQAAVEQTVAGKIDAIVAQQVVSTNTWSMLVENENGSVVYYQKNPDDTKAQASLMKIVTSAGAFGLLGTNHYFETKVFGHGTVASGVLQGDLNLLVKHDITWNDEVFGRGHARKPLEFIAAQIKAKGITNVQGNVQIYGACMYNRSEGSYSRISNQADYNAAGAVALVAALKAEGIAVSGKGLGQTGFSAPGKLLYTYKSTNLTYHGSPLRLDVACIAMGKVSHNVMADLLLRHIGYEQTGTDSYSAGQNQVFKWLSRKVKLKTNDMVMLDGSGLSKSDRFSAREIITIVRYMLGHYPSWDKILPVGCVDGTIDNRFCGTDASGRVHAKTGSLSISIDLSGYVDNPYDHQRYLFAFLANSSTNRINSRATRKALDDAVNVMAGRDVGEPGTAIEKEK